MLKRIASDEFERVDEFMETLLDIGEEIIELANKIHVELTAKSDSWFPSCYTASELSYMDSFSGENIIFQLKSEDDEVMFLPRKLFTTDDVEGTLRELMKIEQVEYLQEKQKRNNRYKRAKALITQLRPELDVSTVDECVIESLYTSLSYLENAKVK